MMNKIFKISFALMTVTLLSACSMKSSNLTSKGSKHFTAEQEAYLKSETYDDTTPYNGNMSISAPEATVLSWKSSGMGTFKVSLYADEALTKLEATYYTKKKSLNFYNEKLMQRYYWNVSDSKGNNVSQTASFKNVIDVAGPRNLNVDGVENFRDLGGWGVLTDTGYKRYIKQGMIYRSGRFNEDKAETVNITISDEGLKEVRDNLKIKTEIDLRRSSTNEIGSLTSSALGEGVRYVNLPMLYEGKNILTYVGKANKDTYDYNNPAMVKEFFEILADENNYPINFHCSIGKDRTGCLSYLIEGLLGFDQELMYRDYMFTNFANAGMCKLQDDILNNGRYGYTLANYANGENINEKVYNYLKDEIGVSAEDLNSVISILKENNTDSLN